MTYLSEQIHSVYKYVTIVFDIKVIRKCSVYGLYVIYATVYMKETTESLLPDMYRLQDDKIAPTGWLVE